MDKKSFEKIVNNRIKKTKLLLQTKQEEYATKDIFHTFKQAAKKRNCSVPEALMGMMVKHQVSLDDIIKNLSYIKLNELDEKIGDYIAYLFLLEGILLEIEEELYKKRTT